MEKQIVHLFVFNTLADWETGFAVLMKKKKCPFPRTSKKF
jgi:hypothetical protein